MELNFIPTTIFRETPEVTFLDASIKGSNGSDIVIHRSGATSPPDLNGFEQYYVHFHQVDNNLVIEGNRTFTLLNPKWEEPHHLIYLDRFMGALQIPIGTYHRSISGKEGSIVINQAIRNADFNSNSEFIPVNTQNREDLQIAKLTDPRIWIWKNGKITNKKNKLFNQIK